jgi:adenine-specific DNA-methyltransferase
MNKDIFTYLRSYSVDPQKINRLIVSAFLHSFKIEKTENKFLKPFLIQPDDEEYSKLQAFLAIHQFSEIEELIEVFEFVISPEEKVVTGAVYTPKHIREYIVEQCFADIEDFENLKICDPACGCSGFLYTAAQLIKKNTNLTYSEIFERNIFGLDIQEFSITRSKLLLTLFVISEGEVADISFNLFHGNALNFNWSNTLQNHEGFDIIVGNPPYVCSRNIDEESKQYIFDWKVSGSGHPDLYIPFFQIGVENLKPAGVLGYITMNTFFKSVNGRALRQYFEEEALSLKILDFGSNQVFQSKSTYTCICIIKKEESKSVQYAKGDEGSLTNGIAFKSIPYMKLSHKNGWNLQRIDLLNRIENTGTPLGELFRTRNGIATLKNHIYIFAPVKEDDDYYYLQNGSVYPVEKGICKEIINPNKLTKVENIDVLRKKAIFPYQYDEQNNPTLLDKEEFKSKYPKAFKYLESKKKILATRDKGKGNYENWYAYGRNQSLEKYNVKLFFPHITPHLPNYAISTDKNLLFYNGIAVVSNNENELAFLKKIMSSRLFWFYITNSSKPYGSGYFSLSRNYIKNFGIYDFTEEEIERIINEEDKSLLNEFIESRYGVKLTDE